MLKQAIRKYQNRIWMQQKVIIELIELAKEMREVVSGQTW